MTRCFLSCGCALFVGNIAVVAHAAEPALSEKEQQLDTLAMAFEDVAEALATVQDLQDADLIASRVAVDFLMLRPLHAEMKNLNKNAQVRPAFAQQFFARCAEARKQALSAIAALNKMSCYDSSALPAAISLAGLMADSLPADKAAAAAMELKINNMEKMADLLMAITDEASAAVVTPLVELAHARGRILDDFAAEYEDTPIPDDLALYFARRVEDYHVDLANQVARIQAEQFFGNVKLAELLTSPDKQQ